MTRFAQAPAATQANPDAVEIIHNGESLKIDPSNVKQVATYTRQLTAEVAVQDERIEHGTQRLGELENMLANHSADRGPEYVGQIENQVEEVRNQLFSATTLKNQAVQSLETLSTAVTAIQRPEVLTLTDPVTPTSDPSSHQEKASGPVDIIHNGQPVQVDPSNVIEVRTLTRQLNTEVSHQSEGIENAEQRIRYLENMLTNHSAGRGPEYKGQIGTEIEAARNQIFSATVLKNQATQSLTILTTAVAQHERAGTQPDAVKRDPTLIQGALLDHGEAPYKHVETNESSYFVSVKTPEGVRTVWGAGLGDLMQQGNFQQGERITLQDKGKEPVTLQLAQADGSVVAKDAYRRVWAVESDAPKAQTPVSAAEQLGTAALVTPAAAAESFIVERELQYRQSMGGLTEADVQSSSTVMGMRGEDHALWLVASNDATPAGLELLTAYMDNYFYRESFKTTMESVVNAPGLSPDALIALEPATSLATRLVNTAENKMELSTNEVSEVATPGAKVTEIRTVQTTDSTNTSATPAKPAKPATTAAIAKSAPAEAVVDRHEAHRPSVVAVEIEELQELEIDN